MKTFLIILMLPFGDVGTPSVQVHEFASMAECEAVANGLWIAIDLVEKYDVGSGGRARHAATSRRVTYYCSSVEADLPPSADPDQIQKP